MQRRYLLSSDTWLATDRVTIACWVRKRLVLPLPLPLHVRTHSATHRLSLGNEVEQHSLCRINFLHLLLEELGKIESSALRLYWTSFRPRTVNDGTPHSLWVGRSNVLYGYVKVERCFTAQGGGGVQNMAGCRNVH